MSSTIGRASLAKRPAENGSSGSGDVEHVVPAPPPAAIGRRLGRSDIETAVDRKGVGRDDLARPEPAPRRGRGPSCRRPSARRSREGSGFPADSPLKVSPGLARRAGSRSGPSSTRQSDRVSVRSSGTQRRARVARVAGAGWPNRLRRPHESSASFGATGVDEAGARRRAASVVRDLQDVGARRRAGLAQGVLRRHSRCRPSAARTGRRRSNESDDRLVVDAVGFAQAGRPSAGR